MEPRDFNSYGARRGNDRVMTRGTFANIRIRNLLVPGTEGGVTRHLPDGALMSIFDAAMLYKSEGVPLVVLANLDVLGYTKPMELLLFQPTNWSYLWSR